MYELPFKINYNNSMIGYACLIVYIFVVSFLCVIQENIVDNYTDGMHEGVQYFESRAGRGKFVRLLGLQRDKRFMDSTTPQQVITPQQIITPQEVTTSQQDFKVGTRVRFGRQKDLGVIKWIGTISGCPGYHVIVKTVSYILDKYIPQNEQHLKHKLQQVDILISKNQALQILYHVASYNRHLQYSDTIWVVIFEG